MMILVVATATPCNKHTIWTSSYCISPKQCDWIGRTAHAILQQGVRLDPLYRLQPSVLEQTKAILSHEQVRLSASTLIQVHLYKRGREQWQLFVDSYMQQNKHHTKKHLVNKQGLELFDKSSHQKRPRFGNPCISTSLYFFGETHKYNMAAFRTITTATWKPTTVKPWETMGNPEHRQRLKLSHQYPSRTCPSHTQPVHPSRIDFCENHSLAAEVPAAWPPSGCCWSLMTFMIWPLVNCHGFEPTEK